MYLFRITLFTSLMAFNLTAIAAEDYRKVVGSSLKYIYYTGNPRPPVPTAAEKNKAVATYKKTRGTERKILSRFLRNDPNLISLAMRDLDQDGVRDYRIDELSGKFMEGDIDVDGDGIRNILDSAPYDKEVGGKDITGDGQPNKGFTDRNRNRIPDHVDWSLQKKSDDLKKIQRILYLKHKIILVERNLKFSTILAHTVFDTVTQVFRRYFAPSLSTLRTIATEKRVHLLKSQDEGVSAMMIPQTQNIFLYTDAETGAPLAKLGLVVHEIMHAIQFAYDFSAKRYNFENKRLLTYPKRYFSYMKRFNWQVKPAKSKAKAPFKSFVGVWKESRPFSEYFRGRHINQWQRWLESGVEKLGFKFLKTPEVRKQNFVSLYATSDIFEWHAEAVMASVMYKIKEVSPEKSAAGMNRDLQGTWPEFHFENIGDSEDHLTISQELKLSPKNWQNLSKKYVR